MPAGTTSPRRSATTPGAQVPHSSCSASRRAENRKTAVSPRLYPLYRIGLDVYIGVARVGDPGIGISTTHTAVDRPTCRKETIGQSPVTLADLRCLYGNQRVDLRCDSATGRRETSDDDGREGERPACSRPSSAEPNPGQPACQIDRATSC